MNPETTKWTELGYWVVEEFNSHGFVKAHIFPDEALAEHKAFHLSQAGVDSTATIYKPAKAKS